ncbi:YggS family pyridoxal phosphate-dependent enzyme [Poritiphilus flavus]|uniref:Pyridoxal phosphate homeostasis protein n=1 Tax=Poritiphilus flavus TaxID=2697053 RepID=A0A6L9EFW8_9FLAO|nr:YggS family pyridoxal phosphate-dependent enzyme [Poritiphilus flavus]NAS13398.1 YggS family pyridoxal phosphate-dependent enzyme [Poritiphilus flavus]
MTISDNLKMVRSRLPDHVELVAVSKTKSNQEIMQAYDAGQRVFGENKVQELVRKQEELPNDIEWHMIGHLQRNKVKYLAPFVTLIHGVDSLKLLREIDKQGKKYQRVIPCLLQMHIAMESSKFGLNREELDEILELDGLEHVKLVGLMGMATFTPDMEQVRKEFAFLSSLFEYCKTRRPGFSILSMGMSGDYEIAIEQGSNMVRIGSAIFGARNYP